MCLVIVVSLKQLFKMYKALTFIAMNDNSGCLYCGILVPKEQTKEESSLISSNPLMSVWYCPPRHLCPIWSPLVSPDSLHTRWPTSLEKSNPQIAKVVTCVCVCVSTASKELQPTWMTLKIKSYIKIKILKHSCFVFENVSFEAESPFFTP